MTSISETIEALQNRHKQFIEATYHLHHPRLIGERRALMRENTVASEPWIESTPKYVGGGIIEELDVPLPVKNILLRFRDAGLGVYREPHLHQTKSLEAFFTRGRDLLVSTGTGSGKTEIFLWSILGQLSLEASRGGSTSQRGLRAIILYPMNALVADQLARLRRIFGSAEGIDALTGLFGRTIQYGMYTGRTLYHGRFDQQRNDRDVRPIIDYFAGLGTGDPDLYHELDEKGRVPRKNLHAFLAGSPSAPPFRTQPGDSELFTRQEMNDPQNALGGTPDILVTNYSMLEYMLLRPIEQPIFADTKNWLSTDSRNQLLIVVDEAHMYRGAQGAEVALLLVRLLQQLGIPRDRTRFILTSATLGTRDRAVITGPEFAAQLTSGAPGDFEVILSETRVLGDGTPGNNALALALTQVHGELSPHALEPLRSNLNWPVLPTDTAELRQFLATRLETEPLFRFIHDSLRQGPATIGSLAESTFPGTSRNDATEALLNFLYLAGQAATSPDTALFPSRLHLMFKGLPPLFACTNPKCNERRDNGGSILGRMYTRPPASCSCGARVFELLSHRLCGAAYLKAYRRRSDENQPRQFLWTDPGDSTDMDELHLLLEPPRSDPDYYRHREIQSLAARTQRRLLDIRTGFLVRPRANTESDSNRFIEVWMPGREQAPREPGQPWTFTQCPACGARQNRRPDGRAGILDLETKGEDPFANIVRTLFEHQPVLQTHRAFPNGGRKVLTFSDGRQKAARLARDLQRTVELDSFREVAVALLTSSHPPETLDQFFPALLQYTAARRMAFFDDSDGDSRTRFVQLQQGLPQVVRRYGLDSVDDIPNDLDAREDLNRQRPRKYDQAILRLLGDRYFSMSATLVGYIAPIRGVLEDLRRANPTISTDTLEEIIVEVLRSAALGRAIDNSITDENRESSRGYPIDGGEGIDESDLIPENAVRKIQTPSGPLSESEIIQLRRSLIRRGTSASIRLFTPLQNQRYVVNPSAVRIVLNVGGTWFRCTGCRQFFPSALLGGCPECLAVLERVRPNDVHAEARRAFFTEPCAEVAAHNREPFNLRSEEHSAQLTYKDLGSIFSKTEEYELLFQDILVNRVPTEQPIDVLSCTTTMEVGIDIGSLTGVAMRTVPPRPENYQQRAGRAGRRGAALSTIVTFADNSPHETYNFENPHRLIGAPASEPIIYIGNPKICGRHLNASMIQRFFHRQIVNGVSPTALEADLFSSLGRAQDFFNDNGDYTLTAFRAWVDSEVIAPGGLVGEHLANLLPDQLRNHVRSSETWRRDFVEATARELVSKLQVLAPTTQGLDQDAGLLELLLDAAILPRFSFPVDLCTFSVVEWNRTLYRPVTRYEMSEDLTQALSDYVPGREIVVDKHTYASYGLRFPFPTNRVDRAEGPHWQSLDWLNFCQDCKTILSERGDDLSARNRTCPLPQCGGRIRSLHIYRPIGFSPQVNPNGTIAELERGVERRRTFVSRASYPLPVDEAAYHGLEARFSNGSARKLENQELLVVNFGRNDSGFDICTRCGAMADEGTLPSPHPRPYPTDQRARGSPRCWGGTVVSTLGFGLQTDLTLFRIRLQSPLNFAPGAHWFESSARSLSEALILGASRALGVDSSEIAGNYRVVGPYAADPVEVQGYLDVFLYDTTPGGAGFATKIYEDIRTVLQVTREILTSCSCEKSCPACLRTYDNRVWHGALDRKLGLAYLDYLVSGSRPILPPNTESTLAQVLYQTLSLLDGEITMAPSVGAPFTFSKGTKCVRVSFVHSANAKPAPSTLNADLVFTEYEVMDQLPDVAPQIITLLG